MLRGIAGIAVLLGVAAVLGPRQSYGEGPEGRKAGLVFLSPGNGASIERGGVVLIGRLPPGTEGANVFLNRRPVEVTMRDGRGFVATLSPQKGFNEVEARSGRSTSRLYFTYAMKSSGKSPYAYHRPVLEGRCRPCHSLGDRRGSRRDEESCRGCHRPMARIFPHVHGPVAAGKCFVCHDPHGSSFPFLLRARARELCTTCHDQPSSMRHIETSRSRVCYLCHNAHGSVYRHLLNRPDLVP